MKIWSSESDEAWLRSNQKQIFTEGADLPMLPHIGYFMVWYAGTEIRITNMLRQATGSSIGPGFELLTYGMDAKVKIERFKIAATDRIGENLLARLNFFNEKVRPVRNKVAHQFAIYNKQRDTISFATLNKIARQEDDKKTLWPGVEPVFEMPLFEFFEYGAWLCSFCQDLDTVKHPLKSRGIFEIIRPTSPLPPAPDQSHAKPKTLATLGRRERKRARKGLQPRSKVSR